MSDSYLERSLKRPFDTNKITAEMDASLDNIFGMPAPKGFFTEFVESFRDGIALGDEMFKSSLDATLTDEARQAVTVGNIITTVAELGIVVALQKAAPRRWYSNLATGVFIFNVSIRVRSWNKFLRPSDAS